ncbi:DUF1934 domain-containing protein [Eupransor demetentiae]|uniref:DUF1934 family (YwiB) n=1 Tax=Eupransor demetentiae TaxID=3109584 RepID=A0ABM9N317_9LACO|nr:DUF1934 family (YwiB) [Lactobacillaceae bacterium LMG 33000]
MADSQAVQVHFMSKIYQDGGDESYQVDAPGSLIVRGDSAYLTYIEQLPDQDEVEVLFKFKDEGIRLNRKGPQNNHMAFELDQKRNFKYETAAGPMQLTTRATEIERDFDLEAGRGELGLNYILYQGDQVLGQYRVELQFEPKLSTLD